MADSDFILRRASWDGWFNDAVILHLDAAVSHYESLGWTASRVRESIEGVADAAVDDNARATKRRKMWQRTC
eukprot:1204959-Pyramimonas_sp.AAC.1